MPAVKTLELRFKVPEISANTPPSQSLLINRTGSDNGSTQFSLLLEYTGSLTSGSYSGSIVDPYSQYGNLKFVLGSESASVYLPFYNGGWWSVMVNQVQGDDLYYTYTLYSKNKIYNGDDGNTIGFQASSSLVTYTGWNQTSTIQIPGSGSATLNGQTYTPATASFQEVRYYSVALSESVFDDYVMNGDSIEGNGINSSYDQLFFRAPLGSELYTGSNSIHPSVNQTASFIDGTSAFSYTGSYNFISNVETAFYDQPAVGIKNAVSNKIRLENGTLYGTTLSGLASLQQNYPASQSYTRNVNYLEVGYSPQNEINEDIMDSIGYFNIGEYIGDPRQISSSNLVYPALEELNKDYFKKYNKSYNYQDYFRIIKFYDNSLFKMIKDFIPARTAAATGAIVKQHLLERNRQRPAQLTWTRPEYSASLLSVARDYETGSIGVFDGGTGGSLTVPQGGIETVFSSGSLIFSTGLYSYFYNLLNNATNEPYTYTISFDVPSGYSDGSLMLFDATGTVSTPSYTPVLFSASMADITGTSQKFTVEVQNGVAISYFFDSINYLDLGNLKVTHELYDPAQGFLTSSINGLLGPVNIPFDTTPYYQGDFSGTTVDVINGKLQDNPLLGEDYKYSIADLQDIDVTVSQDLLIDDLVFDITASIPFDTDALNSPKYDTTTFTYSPEFSNIVDYTVLLQGTYSCSLAGPTGSQSLIADLSINGVTGSYPVTLFTVDNSGPTSDFSGSFTQSLAIPVDSVLTVADYKVVIYEGNPGTAPFFPLTASFQDSRWTVLTENLAAQSTYYLDPTVYTQQNFPGNINEFSEYNSLLNNVYSNRVSSKYFDVDYNSDALTPTNFGPIISQSALYAQIQDSNYVTGSVWNKGRYEGTKLTSATYNTYNDGDITYGKTAVINKYTDYFLYFSSIEEQQSGGGLPGGNVRGVALIGIDGDVISLTPDNQNIGIVQQVFGVFDTVQVVTPTQYLGTDFTDIILTVIIAGGISEFPVFPSPLSYRADETNIFLAEYTGGVFNRSFFSDSPGYLIPANFNVGYINQVIQIAASAGFK